MESRGAIFFRQGFRPFFFAAGLWGAVAVPLWLLVFGGAVSLPTGFDFVAWHAHEMIFGYAGAVVAGFLLTAIPNWTGRLPLSGLPLAGLFAAWLAGRAAIFASASLGAVAAAAIDLTFPVLLLFFVQREIVAGRNWRNLPMPLVLVFLLAANALMHLEAAGIGLPAMLGARLGIAVLILLICLIGGRVIPSFTRNWLAKLGATKLPQPFNGFDKLCLAVTFAALCAWVVIDSHPVTAVALLAAGALNLLRLARWQGQQTLAEPLVWSLHLGFLWVPLGLLLLGVGAAAPQVLPASAGLHALTAGAVAGMTLAVMTRATLGHSGRALTADGWTVAIYLAAAAAAILRVAASASPAFYLPLLHASGAAWILSFGLFTLIYGRLHLSR